MAEIGSEQALQNFIFLTFISSLLCAWGDYSRIYNELYFALICCNIKPTTPINHAFWVSISLWGLFLPLFKAWTGDLIWPKGNQETRHTQRFDKCLFIETCPWEHYCNHVEKPTLWTGRSWMQLEHGKRKWRQPVFYCVFFLIFRIFKIASKHCLTLSQ